MNIIKIIYITFLAKLIDIYILKEHKIELQYYSLSHYKNIDKSIDFRIIKFTLLCLYQKKLMNLTTFLIFSYDTNDTVKIFKYS